MREVVACDRRRASVTRQENLTMKSPLARLELDRRGFVKGLGVLGAAAWSLSPARAFALPEDKIKVVHYFTTPGDAQGRQGQPMVNQSANVVMIETERG